DFGVDSAGSVVGIDVGDLDHGCGQKRGPAEQPSEPLLSARAAQRQYPHRLERERECACYATSSAAMVRRASSTVRTKACLADCISALLLFVATSSASAARAIAQAPTARAELWSVCASAATPAGFALSMRAMSIPAC